jgi:hypothetical protein
MAADQNDSGNRGIDCFDDRKGKHKIPPTYVRAEGGARPLYGRRDDGVWDGMAGSPPSHGIGKAKPLSTPASQNRGLPGTPVG